MFLVCGEALYDIFARPDGEAGRLAMQAVPGGSPFNVAIGLSRLGVPTGFVSRLSTDVLGEALAARLEQEGVSLRAVARCSTRTTLSLVNLKADGVPAYAFYGPGADAALTVADLPDLGPEALGLHIGSYAIVVEPIADALAVLAARAAGRLVALDPNVRLPVVGDLAIWRARIEALLPSVGVVKASEEDLGLLWPGRHREAIARDWLTRGPALAVITQGAEGASAYLSGREAIRVDAPVVPVVDTVGAGDAFQAALIAGLLERGVRGRDDLAALQASAVQRVLARCVLAGALACTRRGADPPRRNELFTQASDVPSILPARRAENAPGEP